MPEKKEGPMQDMIDRGNLSLQVTSTIGLLPVENARVSISYTGEDSVVEEITTDNSGRTEAVSLPAPPLEWSLDAEQTNRPYAELNLQITAPGYQPVTIEGSELLADATALQQVRMEPTEEMQQTEDIVIPDHTLYGEYPPKIPEEEIKPMAETGEIVLSKVVIPEYVVVHDGPPTDSRATNYYVKYKDYTNESLQMDSNPVTMKASKTPAIESSDQTKAAKHEPLVYRVEEIAQLLAISPRAAYNLCNTTTDFRV